MGDGTALVRWMPPNSMGGDIAVVYNVYAGTGVYQMELVASGLTDTEYLVEGIPNGVLHYFAVSASNSQLEGPMSLFVTGTSMRVPSVPLNLRMEVGDGKVTLTWSPPTDLGGDTVLAYEVFFGTSLESLIMTATTEVPSYHEPGLKNGRTYYAMVRAKNAVGVGMFTDHVSGMPIGRPSAPLSLLVVRGDRSLNVTWTRPMDLGGSSHVTYTVYLSNASRSMFPFATNVSATFELLTGLTNGVKYQVIVSAVNPAGESDLSNMVEATPMTVPGAPTFELKPGDSSMNLTWTLPLADGGGEITQVRIYRSLAGKEPSFLRMVPASRGAYTDLDVENGVTYRYALSCLNEVGEGPRSDVKEAAPKAEDETRSMAGLIMASLTVAFIVLAIIAVVIFLMLRKKKASQTQPGPMPPLMQGMTYAQAGAQLPTGYAQGLPQYQQYGLPPAAPPQAPPQQPVQPPLQVQEPAYQQQQSYYPPAQEQLPTQPSEYVPEQLIVSGPLPQLGQVPEVAPTEMPGTEPPARPVQPPNQI
jgi:fibronectin type 3 domain-containing protein